MLLEICRCGHDIATHYKKQHACCGLACECKAYRDRNLPPEPKVPERPCTHPNHCRCYACKRYWEHVFGS